VSLTLGVAFLSHPTPSLIYYEQMIRRRKVFERELCIRENATESIGLIKCDTFSRNGSPVTSCHHEACYDN